MKPSKQQFEETLADICRELTNECREKGLFLNSKSFETRVREVLHAHLVKYGLVVDFSPHAYGFPDIVLGHFGVEVKFSVNDTWRSVANSVFESFRDERVRQIYIVFGKMGGTPAVRWGRYEECVMHVRTSHVPRFEVDIDARESLFKKFGVSYEDFTGLPEDGRMMYVRDYARGRLKPGERLWWLEEKRDGEHSVSMQVRLFANLSSVEKLRMRAEASLLCPQIVGSSRNRTKYVDPTMFLLTYHGVYATRDAFSAGSAAGPERGGNYVKRALQHIEKQMIEAAEYLPGALFKEYWGREVSPRQRIKEWLLQADLYAKSANPPWKPSKDLFQG